jgi:hypothetical protein
MPVVLELTGEIAAQLSDSLFQGPILNRQGQRLLEEASIGRFGGFKVDIFADEHPPPHFRVSYQGENASYRITDGAKIVGGLDRYQRNIAEWYQMNRTLLINAWNERRPSDCPVGIVKA